MYAASLASMVLTSVTATDFNAPYVSSFIGYGRFLLYKSDAAFALTISGTSSFTCSSTAYTQSTILTSLSSSTYSQGSAFHIDTMTTGLTLTVSDSTFANCYTANIGGVFYLTRGAASPLVFTSNTFSKNVALTGGAIYCDGCTWTTLQ